MLDQKFFKKIQAEYNQADREKREVQKVSGDALHAAKRAIFDLHRGDVKSAKATLKEALFNLQKAGKIYTDKSVDDEGLYRAATEEYAEAELFRQFVENETIGEIQGVKIGTNTYLGGLTDLVGEILRYAVKQATLRRPKELVYAGEIAEEIMAALIGFNFTGYLRTKYDQAKNGKRKLEELLYEVSVKLNLKSKI